MDIFYEPHRQLLKALLDAHVEFILIGGYAVNFHGYTRPTGDLDIWLKPSEENKKKLLDVLEENDFTDESLEYIQSLNFAEAEVFAMGEPPIRVDFLTKISGVSYADADKEKVIVDVEGMENSCTSATSPCSL